MTKMENRKVPIDSKCIVHSLRDRAVRSSDPSAERIMLMAADAIGNLEQEVIQLKEKLREQEEKNKWISAKERLPERSGEYLVMIVGAERPTALWYNPVEDIWFEDDYRDCYPVLSWKPFPEKPKEVDHESES